MWADEVLIADNNRNNAECLGFDHIEQIRVTVILNIHEVKTSPTAGRVHRRREFIRVFRIMKCNPIFGSYLACG